MSNINKIELLNNGIYHIYKRFRYLQFLFYSTDKTIVKWKPQITYDYEYFINLIDNIEHEKIKNCERIFNAHRKKSERLKKRIETLLEKDCVFITFTFTDKVLENTSATTRRRYISRELNSLNVPYIANIDFGKQNEREHYHGIAQVDYINRDSYDLGGIYVERIYNKNSLSLAKYINKLTNHALKETTGSDRLLYSKKKG